MSRKLQFIRFCFKIAFFSKNFFNLPLNSVQLLLALKNQMTVYNKNQQKKMKIDPIFNFFLFFSIERFFNVLSDFQCFPDKLTNVWIFFETHLFFLALVVFSVAT